MESVFKEINIVNNMIRQYICENTMKFSFSDDVSRNEGAVIKYICEHRDKIICQKDIEKVLMVRKSTITEMLNKMEKKDLIERKDVPHDKRLKQIIPTEKSIMRHQEIISKIQAIENHVINGLSEIEIERFLFILGKIKENLSNKGEKKW